MEEKKNRKGIVFAAVLLVFLAAVGGFFFWQKQKSRNMEKKEWPEGMEQEQDTYVTAGGTTVAGITEEMLELEKLDTELWIEEVYLTTGGTVSEGEPILKLSEASLEKARQELTRRAKQAELLYRQGVLEQELSLIEAAKTRDMTGAEAEYAQADYETSLQEAHQTVEELEEKTEEAREIYEEYYAGVYEDGYAEEYALAEKKALYEENEKIYQDTLKKWNIKDKEVNRAAGNGDTGGNPSGGMGGNSAAAADKSQRLTALGIMEDTWRTEKEEYELAVEAYNSAVAKAQAGLENAKAEYELLQLELEQAEIDYEKQAAVCKADYETQLAEMERAQSVYDSTAEQLQEKLLTLENDKEETAEQLAIFEEAIGDGCLYAKSQGTVLMVAAEAGGKLEPDVVVTAYSDPTVMTVSAAVGQEDIASLQVGEEAVVVTAEQGNLTAFITQIDPVSALGSSAGVSYQVTLAFQEIPEGLSANATVNVCFGLTAEAYEQQM